MFKNHKLYKMKSSFSLIYWTSAGDKIGEEDIMAFRSRRNLGEKQRLPMKEMLADIFAFRQLGSDPDKVYVLRPHLTNPLPKMDPNTNANEIRIKLMRFLKEYPPKTGLDGVWERTKFRIPKDKVTGMIHLPMLGKREVTESLIIRFLKTAFANYNFKFDFDSIESFQQGLSNFMGVEASIESHMDTLDKAWPFMKDGDKWYLVHYPEFIPFLSAEQGGFIKPLYIPTYFNLTGDHELIYHYHRYLAEIVEKKLGQDLKENDKFLYESNKKNFDDAYGFGKKLERCYNENFYGNGCLEASAGRFKMMQEVRKLRSEKAFNDGDITKIKPHLFDKLMEEHYPFIDTSFLEKVTKEDETLPFLDYVRKLEKRVSQIDGNQPGSSESLFWIKGSSDAGILWQPDAEQRSVKNKEIHFQTLFLLNVMMNDVKKLMNKEFGYEHFKTKHGYLWLNKIKPKSQVSEIGDLKTNSRVYNSTVFVASIPAIVFLNLMLHFKTWNNNNYPTMKSYFGWSPYHGGIDYIVKRISAQIMKYKTKREAGNSILDYLIFSDNCNGLFQSKGSNTLLHPRRFHWVSFDGSKQECSCNLQNFKKMVNKMCDKFEGKLPSYFLYYMRYIYPTIACNSVGIFGGEQISFQYLSSGTAFTTHGNQMTMGLLWLYIEEEKIYPFDLDEYGDIKVFQGKPVMSDKFLEACTFMGMKVKIESWIEDVDKKIANKEYLRLDVLGHDATFMDDTLYYLMNQYEGDQKINLDAYENVGTYVPVLQEERALKMLCFYKDRGHKLNSMRAKVIRFMRLQLWYIMGGWANFGATKIVKSMMEEIRSEIEANLGKASILADIKDAFFDYSDEDVLGIDLFSIISLINRDLTPSLYDIARLLRSDDHPTLRKFEEEYSINEGFRDQCVKMYGIFLKDTETHELVTEITRKDIARAEFDIGVPLIMDTGEENVRAAKDAAWDAENIEVLTSDLFVRRVRKSKLSGADKDDIKENFIKIFMTPGVYTGYPKQKMLELAPKRLSFVVYGEPRSVSGIMASYVRRTFTKAYNREKKENFMEVEIGALTNDMPIRADCIPLNIMRQILQVWEAYMTMKLENEEIDAKDALKFGMRLSKRTMMDLVHYAVNLKKPPPELLFLCAFAMEDSYVSKVGRYVGMNFPFRAEFLRILEHFRSIQHVDVKYWVAVCEKTFEERYEKKDEYLACYLDGNVADVNYLEIVEKFYKMAYTDVLNHFGYERSIEEPSLYGALAPIVLQTGRLPTKREASQVGDLVKTFDEVMGSEDSANPYLSVSDLISVEGAICMDFQKPVKKIERLMIDWDQDMSIRMEKLLKSGHADDVTVKNIFGKISSSKIENIRSEFKKIQKNARIDRLNKEKEMLDSLDDSENFLHEKEEKVRSFPTHVLHVKPFVKQVPQYLIFRGLIRDKSEYPKYIKEAEEKYDENVEKAQIRFRELEKEWVDGFNQSEIMFKNAKNVKQARRVLQAWSDQEKIYYKRLRQIVALEPSALYSKKKTKVSEKWSIVDDEEKESKINKFFKVEEKDDDESDDEVEESDVGEDDVVDEALKRTISGEQKKKNAPKEVIDVEEEYQEDPEKRKERVQNFFKNRDKGRSMKENRNRNAKYMSPEYE